MLDECIRWKERYLRCSLVSVDRVGVRSIKKQGDVCVRLSGEFVIVIGWMA